MNEVDITFTHMKHDIDRFILYRKLAKLVVLKFYLKNIEPYCLLNLHVCRNSLDFVVGSMLFLLATKLVYEMSEEVRWTNERFGGYRISQPVEEDVDLTHVGAGTPCGEYMRRFWHPVAMTEQLGDKPVPIRILGENLVIFRDLTGHIGLLHRQCAHRRASLEFGKIEQNGIRCCYHGWQFDVDGTILDTPGEPEDSPIKHRICQGAYPIHEYRGLIFAYMGPPDKKPDFPFLDSFDISGHEMIPYSIHSPCNWLQESENSMDPFHSVFLHGRVNGPQFPGLEHFIALPVVEYFKRPEGFSYSHARRQGDLVMMRFHDHITPNMAQNGGMFQRLDNPKIFGRTSLTKWVVPVDDTNSRKFGWRHFNDADEVLRQGDKDNVGWEKVDFYGQTAHRTAEERISNPGDWEAWTSQGPINIHKREYLGTTDEGITLLRSKIKKDIRNVERGKDVTQPQGSEDRPFHTYGGDTILRVPEDPVDDLALMRRLQHEVAEIYFAADQYEGDDRADFILRGITEKFGEQAIQVEK
ncbi:MAG: phenylpropionate dioxygenase-like ring-hydroxylating dioxygenase large terminal subunit [Gammaproteobacteria bacterium]